MKNGLVQIYTGPGKGKTTASIGLAVRAAGYGFKVGIWHFLKPNITGEVKFFKNFKQIKITRLKPAHPLFSNDKNLQKIRRKNCLNLSAIAREIKRKRYDLIILDEIVTCITEKLISQSSVIKFIQDKPKAAELIITGRGATRTLMRYADYVSFIKNTKQPLKKGLRARKGIEY